jgi:spermidine/putrescine transport system permease protein
MVKNKDFWKRFFALTYIFALLLLMYLPIFVLIIFSFTDSPKLGVYNGFTFALYAQLFADTSLQIAIGNTVIIALISALCATVIGTLGAIGVFECKKHTKKAIEFATNIPVVNPEIVIALSLTVMFVFVGSYIFKGFQFSFWTLLAGHLVLSVPFVYLSVKPKLVQMDPSLYEAALDLGCTPRQALRKTVYPEILPGIQSGFLLAITLSLDDFIVTAFTTGPGLLSGAGKIETISTYVQAIIKKKPLPADLRALCTLIFLLVLSVVIIYSIYNSRAHHKNFNKHAKARAKL